MRIKGEIPLVPAYIMTGIFGLVGLLSAVMFRKCFSPENWLAAADFDGDLTTAYGPGDRGYLGGRWWLDANGNGAMDEGETFVCPLLGPGS